MKSLAVTLLSVCCVLNLAAAARSIKVSGTPEKITRIEILKANGKPVVDYAAKELQTLLSKAVGTKVAVVKKPSPGAFTLILGDGEVTRKAGIDVEKLPPEGFYLKRQGRQLFIAGRDSDTKSPTQSGFNVYYQRGTLSGVYDFLERFAQARFFFPGPHGTVVPAKDALYLPGTIDIMDSPDMSFRRFSLHGSPGEKYYDKYNVQTLRRALLPRLRSSERRVPFTHGLNGLDFIGRFRESNPEYFALMANGQRYSVPGMKLTGQLCFSSAAREVIIQDAIAYFSGKPAASRGMKRWLAQTATGNSFCIMPQDGMYWCRCEKCRKIWDGKGRSSDPEANKAISTFMYTYFKEVCDRVRQAGIKDFKITTMAYSPYNIAPEFPLPKELVIQVAVNGLMGGNRTASDTERLKMWYDRTGNKVTAWTYAMGKHQNKVIPGVPAMMPRNAAEFIKTNRKYLDGVYFESETDFFLFNYLNYYTIMKLMWNSSLDVEELLADHFKVMFGKGAPFMAEFYADLENNWTKKILGNTVETDLGPVAKVPSIREIWTHIYSPAKLAYYETLFDKALKAAGNDKDAVVRLNYIRKEILAPIRKEAARQQELQSGMDFWKAQVPGSVWLRPFKGEINDVNTRISLRMEKESLIIRADCEEPLMKNLIADTVKRDDVAVFTDSVIEILLNPSGDRKNYFQFGANVNGALADARCRVDAKTDFSWNSGATAKGGREKDSWWVEVTIPLKDLGPIDPKGIPANFARNRVVNKLMKKNYSMWSLYAGTRQGGFHAIDSWGKIVFTPDASASLIPNGNFEKLSPKNKRPLYWSLSQKTASSVSFDEKCFISGGRALRIDSDGTRNVNVGCNVPGIKPGKRYRLSYFVRTEKLSGKIGAGAWIYFHSGPGGGLALPRVRLIGTNPWHRLSFEFKAPAQTGKNGYVPHLGLWVWNAKGKVWYDNIHLEELP